MRIAFSNIAWDVAEDIAVAALLVRNSVDAIDIAPGKYFPAPERASDQDIAAVRNWWAGQGISITGMQALLFGTSGLNLFGPPEVQDAMLKHLAAVCRIAAGLGAKKLVFGSPKNRDRSELGDDDTMAVATSFLRQLGSRAQACGVLICLEPNPTAYGANFMTTSADTANVVRRVGHPAIRMQLDTGALTMNGESPTAVLQDCADLIGHVHASEPQLVPLGDGATDHGQMAQAVNQYLPQTVVSIEMVATVNEPHLASVTRALQVALQHYRNPQQQART